MSPAMLMLRRARRPRVLAWTRWLLGAWLACMVVVTEAFAATAPGTVITNQAAVFVGPPVGTRDPVYSNLDRIEVVGTAGPRTPARITIWRWDRGGGELTWIRPSWTNGRLIPLPPQLPVETDGTALIGIRTARSFRSGEPVFMELADWDQNEAADVTETVEILVANGDNSDRERYVLTETGPNTGRFTGCIPTTVLVSPAGDGAIGIAAESSIVARYTDPRDATDAVATQAVIDPFGTVFDSTSGRPIDGVTITIVDAGTGRPATVFGNDGGSVFPSTVVSGTTVRDAGGTTYVMPAGAFVFPVLAPGTYRYEITLPARAGFTFPSSATDATLQSLPGAPFALTPASRGAAFAVELDPVATDLPLDPEATALLLTKHALATTAANGDLVAYEISASNQRSLAPLEALVITDRLPAGFRLDATSVRVNDQPVSAASAADGRSFSLAVSGLAPGASVTARYLARVASAPAGPATNEARARAGRLEFNAATATIIVHDELMATRAHIVGRVVQFADGEPTSDGIPGVAVILETGSMSVTDARGFFRFDGVWPGTHVVQLDTATLPAGAVIAPSADGATTGGSAWSRFADVAAGTLWNVEFAVTLAVTAENRATDEPERPAGVKRFDAEWLAEEPLNGDWLLPEPEESPPTPVTRIVVKHASAYRIIARLNGAPVPAVNFDGVVSDPLRGWAASVWSGVNLREGTNEIEIVRLDSFGLERGREIRHVHFAAPPVRAELVSGDSTLIADGVTPPLVAVRLFDREDRPARAGVRGRFTVDEPYHARRDERLDLRLLPGALPEAPEFIVGENGVAHLRLEPTTTSGRARMRLALVSGEIEILADLRVDRRDWIVVGLAEGTAAYRTISGNLENARDEGVASGMTDDGRMALFVRGRVRGQWLLTAAYDSAKRTEPQQALHGGIEPDAYYTVYGDQSDRFENSASREKLYVKLERETATLLFGDFTLDWTSGTFTTYNRDLHGAMAGVRAGAVRVSGFQSDAGLSFVRDELPGTGLSTAYPLSRRGIVPFSERVVIEERDALRPDVVVRERVLARNVDYTIDALVNGVRLREPLFSHSPARNPQFLVVRYELEDATAGEVLGGRVEFRAGTRLVAGAAVVSEQHDGATSHVAGLDARTQLGSSVIVAAEIAQSDGPRGAASAYRAEVKHLGAGGETRAYFREVGEGFGLGQLNASATGNRQFGLEGTQRLTTTIAARELIYDETLLVTGDRRRAGEMQVEWTLADWTLRSGARAARDRRADGTEAESLLATAGVTRRLLGARLELRLDHDQSLDGAAGNPDFPTRTVFGAAYALNAQTRILAEQEWTDAIGRRTATTRAGVQSTPWTGGDLSGVVAHNQFDAASTLLGGGVKQTLHFGADLEVEGGFEHAQVVSGEAAGGPAGAPAPTPFHRSSGFAVVPQGNATAVFAGAHWKPGDILYNGRAEYRTDDDARRMVLLASAQAEPGTNLGVIASLVAQRSDLTSGRSQCFVDARFGTAWRPADGNLIVLNRLDVVRAPVAAAADGHTWKLIENLHLNWRLGDAQQLSLHFGGKYAAGHFGGLARETLTTLVAVEWRRPLVGPWDVGVHASVLSGWGAATHRAGLGLSLGRVIADNAWVSLGFNFDGVRDGDFTAARFSAPGMFVRFRLKFDQNSIAGLLRAIKED